MPPKQTLTLTDYDKFHEYNLFIPTRTIYFAGKTGNIIEGEVADEVTSSTTAELIKNLQILEHREIAPISILLNSCGGSWEDGMAVYDFIKASKSHVTIIGLGKIYSMGSVIMQAGDDRILTQNSYMMIHDGSEGYIGTPRSFEAWAKFSEATRSTMYKIYYDRMKKKNRRITLKEIEKICSHDTIYTAEQAVQVGLADEIIINPIKK